MNKTTLLLALSLAAPLPTQAQSTESLINPNAYRALAADQRAYRVGDVITILVEEATKAKSGATTDASSDLGLHAGLQHPKTNYNASLTVGGGNRGGAETTRVGELRTQITVQVDNVLPNGTMHVAGVHDMTVNGEHQTIRLSGLVRPQDISSDNAVWSNRLGNAELELVGKGVVSESQRQSIFYRIFKWLRLM
ncbi:flagellar basal body L-ring protein FlgH [Solilutibacter silvestris]|uniref:flagellar basal body L-ring protein FlgH n=1 Tax=Solilutibacter silvestris TaxID=1645665 RepID=UPI003D329706